MDLFWFAFGSSETCACLCSAHLLVYFALLSHVCFLSQLVYSNTNQCTKKAACFIVSDGQCDEENVYVAKQDSGAGSINKKGRAGVRKSERGSLVVQGG